MSANTFSLALGPPPEGGSLEEQDFGWANSYGTGNADDAITSGLEVIWSKTPTKWSNGILPFYAPIDLMLTGLLQITFTASLETHGL